MAEGFSKEPNSFDCPVCLDQLEDPVTIPCGHNYCLGCIRECWDQADSKGVYSCPQCRKTFPSRPVLSKNTLMAEMVKEFSQARIQPAVPTLCSARPKYVECDACTGRKLKAVKHCQTCMVSCCEAHFKSLHEHPVQIHKSVDPPPSLCSQHGKPTVIFCRTDQSYICSLCKLEDHKKHDSVSTSNYRTQKLNVRSQILVAEHKGASILPGGSPVLLTKSSAVWKPAVRPKPQRKTQMPVMEGRGSQRQESVGGAEASWEDDPEYFTSKLIRWLEREKEQTIDCVRLVLIGKTGVGKSATGNTILRSNNFKSSVAMASVTTKCKKKTAMIGTRMLQVIDTPGLFDTSVSSEKTREEIGKCITMSSPGPHVFLLLVSVGRFTREERETVKMIQEIFGERSKVYTMVGFTRGETLQEERISIEEYIQSGHEEMRGLIEECGGRYHVFCNAQKNNVHQVSSLLEKIDKMIQQNGGTFYTTAMFEETEKNINAREIKFLHERVEELMRSSKGISASYSKVPAKTQKVQRERNGRDVQGEPDKLEDEKRIRLEKFRLNKKMFEEISSELAKSRNGIRKQAEKDEAKATAKALKPKHNKCPIS